MKTFVWGDKIKHAGSEYTVIFDYGRNRSDGKFRHIEVRNARNEVVTIFLPVTKQRED